MKKISLFLLALIMTLGTVLAQNNEVPFTVAERYFVKNSYPERALHMLKITDRERFDSIFGMASVMGKGGQPTPINFSESFVIVLIDNAGYSTLSDIAVKSLTKYEGHLSLVYQMQHDDASIANTRRFCEILIVDNKYMGTVSANCYAGESGSPLSGCDLDESGCKPSTGESWSILRNDCIQVWTTKYVLEGVEINDVQNAALLFSEGGLSAEIIGVKYKPNIILVKESDKEVWKNEELSLIKIAKDQFVLKEKDKEIGKGRLRK